MKIFRKKSAGDKGSKMISEVIGRFEYWKQELIEGKGHIAEQMMENAAEIGRIETNQKRLEGEMVRASRYLQGLELIAGELDKKAELVGEDL